jgi:putative spermidine/putrescine transport system permease protein
MENQLSIDSPNLTGRFVKRKEQTKPYQLTATAVVFVALFLLAPLLLMLRLSFDRYDSAEMYIQAFTLDNYIKFFKDSFYQQVLWKTLWISAVTTALCLFGGLAVAYYLTRARSVIVQRYLVIAIVLPLFMGSVARTAGWIIIFDNKGLLNFLLLKAGIASTAIQLLYTSGAVIAGLTSVLLPYMIVTLNSVMHNIDVSLEEASQSLGASPLTTFFRIVVPLLMPGIFAGCVLCFTLSMSAYATPILLGGPKFYMMAPLIYTEMSAAMNWPFASALAFTLILLTMVLTLTSSIMFNRSARADFKR